jgi:hypothetical protein
LQHANNFKNFIATLADHFRTPIASKISGHRFELLESEGITNPFFYISHLSLFVITR